MGVDLQFHAADHGLDKVLDRKLIAAVKDSIETGAPVTMNRH